MRRLGVVGVVDRVVAERVQPVAGHGEARAGVSNCRESIL